MITSQPRRDLFRRPPFQQQLEDVRPQPRPFLEPPEFRPPRPIVGFDRVVNANVQTVDAVIMGVYEGNMVATGNVAIAETGRVTGNIETDSLVISKGGFFNGNVVKSKGDDVAVGPRPVHLVDGARAVTTQR